MDVVFLTILVLIGLTVIVQRIIEMVCLIIAVFLEPAAPEGLGRIAGVLEEYEKAVRR